MRQTAWMMVGIVLVGCGTNVPAKVNGPTSQSAAATVSDVAIPVEVENLIARGELSQAVDVLTAMIAKVPKDASLYALRSTTYFRSGIVELATADIDHAIELNTRDASLYNNRGYMRLSLKQYDDAQQDFAKAIELAPGYKNAYNNLGLLLVAQRQFDGAIVQFNKAIQIDSKYVDAYNNRGFAEYEAGQIAKALDDFNVAIEMNPNYFNAYNNRGLMRARAGDYANAVLDFNQAMELDPLNPKYYEHRRDVYQRQGEYRQVVEDERKIDWLYEYHDLTAEIAVTKDPVEPLVLRARHFLEVEDFDKALIDLNRALSLDSDDVPALLTRAGVYVQTKSWQAAKADAEAALAKERSEQAYSILGDVYLGLEDFDHAIEFFAKSRRIDESVAEAYYRKSKLLSQQGQEEPAKKNLDQALALDPEIEHRIR